MTLELYLAVALGGAFFVYFLGKLSSRLRDIFAVLVSLAVLVMTIYLYGRPLEKTFYFGFLNFPLVLRLTMLSWFFAITIAGIGFLSIIYSLNYMKNNEISLIINTPSGKKPRRDIVSIRTIAVNRGVPLVTTIPGAKATLLAIKKLIPPKSAKPRRRVCR